MGNFTLARTMRFLLSSMLAVGKSTNSGIINFSPVRSRKKEQNVLQVIYITIRLVEQSFKFHTIQINTDYFGTIRYLSFTSFRVCNHSQYRSHISRPH